MSDTPSDLTGLQWLFNLIGLAVMALLGGGWRHLQVQIRDLKTETRAGDDAIRREMNDRVDQRFDALDQRDEERRRVNAERHADNQAELERNRQATLATNEGMATLERRIIDALDRLTREVAALPSRPEVRDMVSAAIHSINR